MADGQHCGRTLHRHLPPASRTRIHRATWNADCCRHHHNLVNSVQSAAVLALSHRTDVVLLAVEVTCCRYDVSQRDHVVVAVDIDGECSPVSS